MHKYQAGARRFIVHFKIFHKHRLEKKYSKPSISPKAAQPA